MSTPAPSCLPAALARALVALVACRLPAGALAEGGVALGDVLGAAPSISWEASPFAVSSLLLELEGALGSGQRREVQGRLDRVEAELRPTFAAIHKNGHGNLEPAGVRYILHRYFRQKYSWVVKGLDTGGQAWNVSSPVELLRGHVPASAVASFERRLGARGFGVRDAAALAATVETLIQAEAAATVEALYTLHGLPTAGNVSAGDVDAMLDTYLAALIVQANLTAVAAASAGAGGPQAGINRGSAASEVFGVTVSGPARQSDLALGRWRADLQAEIAQIYPAWPQTQSFMREARKRAQAADGAFAFPAVLGVVGQVTDGWGRWRNHECQHTKDKLLEIEDRTAGCVRLADFYRSMTEKGVWQFGESVKYLREQGILEESVRGDPHVIVPNYLTSQGNCLSTSQFYSTCCLSECEELLDSIEMQVSAPHAAPSEIAALVARLPSTSVPAHRVLSADLLQHLDEIAWTHDGKVPLFGRLFAQWMHHAYPRECPYPHLSGTTHQRSIWDMKDSAVVQSSVFTEQQARAAIASLPNQSAAVGGPRAASGTCVPWHHVEELIVGPATMQSLAALEMDPAVWTAARAAAMASLLATVLVALMRLLRDSRRAAAAAAWSDAPKMEV